MLTSNIIFYNFFFSFSIIKIFSDFFFNFKFSLSNSRFIPLNFYTSTFKYSNYSSFYSVLYSLIGSSLFIFLEDSYKLGSFNLLFTYFSNCLKRTYFLSSSILKFKSFTSISSESSRILFLAI